MSLRNKFENFNRESKTENLYISVLIFIAAFIIDFLNLQLRTLVFGLFSLSFYFLWYYIPERSRNKWQRTVSLILTISGIFLLFILFFMSYLATYYNYIIWKEIGRSFAKDIFGGSSDFYIFYTITIPILLIITSLLIRIKNVSAVVGILFIYMSVISWMYIIMEGIYFQYSTTGTGFAELFKPRHKSDYTISIGVGSGELKLWPESKWYPVWIMGYREIFGTNQPYSWFPIWVIGYQTIGIGGPIWYLSNALAGFIFLAVAVIAILNAFYKETGIKRQSIVQRIKNFMKNYYNAVKLNGQQREEIKPVSYSFIENKLNKVNYFIFIGIYITFMILMGNVISLSWIFWASGIFILAVGFIVYLGIGEKFLGKITKQEIYSISVLFTVIAFYIPFLIITSIPQTQNYINILSDNFTFQLALVLPIGLALVYITYVFSSRGKIMKLILEIAWLVLIIVIISSTLQYIFGIIFEKGRGREIADANLIFEVGMLFSVIGISAIVGIYYGYRSSIVVLIPGITVVLLFPIIRDAAFLLVGRESILNIFKYQSIYENQQIFMKITLNISGTYNEYYWSLPFLYYYRIIIAIIVVVTGFFVLGIIANRDVKRLGTKIGGYLKVSMQI